MSYNSPDSTSGHFRPACFFVVDDPGVWMVRKSTYLLCDFLPAVQRKTLSCRQERRVGRRPGLGRLGAFSSLIALIEWSCDPCRCEPRAARRLRAALLLRDAVATPVPSLSNPAKCDAAVRRDAGHGTRDAGLSVAKPLNCRDTVTVSRECHA
ncbi:hypothetical protein J6590_027769 [Homalodisca vitripennis]|nr:hypothetical protein J6590_027769 [Homalodisca vitripennis]